MFATFPLQEVGVLARSRIQETTHEAWPHLSDVADPYSVGARKGSGGVGERALIM